ncbi:hypothetical protein [Acidianus brierleyi]|uniref:Membrane protein 6-pyruvoyl-tetrahydropterin synthase-related domain-containing protein n=1 Tax=Acidianus brierleyi TaxID=41673 RepID=A0A2U9IDI4_9CREN|nr:hypothetical protein [Acidianus brierleyi]AWR94081.1 hypothetical protein DFR85_05190 [Acidianus brierleyi]
MRNKELIYAIIVISIYLIIFRNLLLVNIHVITEVPSYFSIGSLGVTFLGPGNYLYFLIYVLGGGNGEKFLYIFPFILGSLGFHFLAKQFSNNFIVKYIAPFFFMLNPGSSSILITNPEIIFDYSLLPFIFYFSYKIYKKFNLIDFLYLTGLLIIGQAIYFEMFFIAFIFQFPLILFAISSKIKEFPKFLAYIIAADSMAFISEIGVEIGSYITASSIGAAQYKFGYYLYGNALFFLILSLILASWSAVMKRNRISISIVATASLLLFITTFFSNIPVNVPLIGDLLLTLTTYEQKIILFTIGLLLLSFIFINKKDYMGTFLLLLVVIAGTLAPSYFPLLNNTYDLLNLKSSAYYDVYPQWSFTIDKYILDHQGIYTEGVGNPCNSTLQGLPYLINISNKYEPHYYVKYVVSQYHLTNENLSLMFHDHLYIYKNDNYKGLTVSPNTKPLNFTFKNYEITVYGNYSKAIIFIPYSQFWTNAKNYQGFLEINMKNGIGHAYLNLIIPEMLFYISLIPVIIEVVLLIYKKLSNILIKVFRYSLNRNNH